MKLRSQILALAAVAATALHAQAAVETYTIDPVHSSVGFTIRHFVSKVPGKFTKLSGQVSVDRANPANNSVSATIDATSLNTENKKRDDHVRSADFLDAAKFPTIAFKSTSWQKTGENTYDVSGDLTIKDVTKPVVLKVTALGFGPGMGGTQLSGWEATTKIDKKEFNVKDPAMLDAALGDDVTITINIEAGMKKA
ncbi:MAG: YceI family protein [Opitutaceae bacterium]|nr:YceI family protein [Opitutaceae bacterium]